jgi:hypothetical protein
MTKTEISKNGQYEDMDAKYPRGTATLDHQQSHSQTRSSSLSKSLRKDDKIEGEI